MATTLREASSPFASLWAEDAAAKVNSRYGSEALVPRAQGGEVEEASTWWRAEFDAALDEWESRAAETTRGLEARAAAAKEMVREANERAKEAALEKVRAAEAEAARLRKEKAQLRARRLAKAVAEKKPPPKEAGAHELREAAAAAARANPPKPKRMLADAPGSTGASSSPGEAQHAGGLTGGDDAQLAAPQLAPSLPEQATGDAASARAASAHAASAGAASARATHALSGYWFEDVGECIKVSVPLDKVCACEDLSAEACEASFSEFGFRLQVKLQKANHVLNVPEVAYPIDPARSTSLVRTKSKRLVLKLAKREPSQVWRKLAAI